MKCGVLFNARLYRVARMVSGGCRNSGTAAVEHVPATIARKVDDHEVAVPDAALESVRR